MKTYLDWRFDGQSPPESDWRILKRRDAMYVAHLELSRSPSARLMEERVLKYGTDEGWQCAD